MNKKNLTISIDKYREKRGLDPDCWFNCQLRGEKAHPQSISNGIAGNVKAQDDLMIYNLDIVFKSCF